MNPEKNLLFGEPVVDIIRRRKSVRTYSQSKIPADIQDGIQRYFEHLKGPFQVKIRFELLEKMKIRVDAQIKLGTYGMILGASSFIAAAVEKNEHHLEQLGYVFENLILYLTSLGLGTCWLAGTFNKSEFSRAMRIDNNEILPIVTPVGYESKFRSPLDGFLKPIPALKIRKPWEKLFFKDNFAAVLPEKDAAAYALPLEMARLAPSASNKQPWRIVKENRDFHFFLAHDPVYRTRYPYDIQNVDLGIAMFHFEATARELGLKGQWDLQTSQIKDAPKDYEYIVTWVEE